MASLWKPDAGTLPIDKGYYVRKPNLQPEAKGSRTNALLINSEGKELPLWVNQVQAAFGVTGSTAQSSKKRQFFPKNLNQPTLEIAGQTPNQYEYGRIAEFVREAQLNGILGNPTGDQKVLTFKMGRGGTDTRRRIQRGEHQSIVVDGYINKVERKTERFVNAPPYTLSFVITKIGQILGMKHLDAIETNQTIPITVIDVTKGIQGAKSFTTGSDQNSKPAGGDGNGKPDVTEAPRDIATPAHGTIFDSTTWP